MHAIYGLFKNTESKVSFGQISILVILVFLAKVIITPDLKIWQPKFLEYSVPSVAIPGGDARNIQLSAYCQSATKDGIGYNDCYSAAKIIKSHHPDAIVNPYNYPPVWREVYKLIGDYSESFFMRVWQINAISLIITIAALAWRFKNALFPVAVLNPIVLFTIERGNNDALVFAIMFGALSIGIRSKFIVAFGFGLAAGAKVFPLFAFPILAWRLNRSSLWPIGIALVLVMPLMLWALTDLSDILLATTQGFRFAYGLRSIQFSPFLDKYSLSSAGVIAVYLLIYVSVVLMMVQTNMVAALVAEICERDEFQTYMLMASMMIFTLTFLLFNNWAYRLIFLIPSMFLLSTLRSKFGRFLSLCIIGLLWSPVLFDGWLKTNLLCYALAPFTTAILIYFLVPSLRIIRDNS